VTVRLLDTNHDIRALTINKLAMNMLRLLNRQLDGFAPVAAVAQNPAVMIDHLPTPLAGGIDMEGMVAATRRHLNRRAVSE
jgi:hypothetical protein